ncbi:hypothetical protein D3C77_613430 [compost metagenome]
MDDHAALALQHRWEQSAIQAHGRHQVQVELALPLRVIQHREAAARCRRTTQDVDDDVHAAQPLLSCGYQCFAAFWGREVGLHEQLSRQIAGCLPSRGQHLGALCEEQLDDRAADAFGAAGDQHLLAAKIKVHGAISSERIWPFCSRNR